MVMVPLVIAAFVLWGLAELNYRAMEGFRSRPENQTFTVFPSLFLRRALRISEGFMLLLLSAFAMSACAGGSNARPPVHGPPLIL